jgi:hypothetical protein
MKMYTILGRQGQGPCERVDRGWERPSVASFEVLKPTDGQTGPLSQRLLRQAGCAPLFPQELSEVLLMWLGHCPFLPPDRTSG